MPNWNGLCQACGFCGNITENCSVLAAERRSKNFPYLDLPKEIRIMILELLLVRGNIAMCCDDAIKGRFSSFERPHWALRAVNRQMRAEAAEVGFSSKNTFFVPLGGVQHGSRQFRWAPKLPWPEVKRLDCAFDLRDDSSNNYDNLFTVNIQKYIYDASHGTGTFERLTSEEKWVLLHGSKVDNIMEIWLSSVDAILSMSLDVLILDLTNCRCPAGCCRLGLEALDLFEFNDPNCYPKRIEIIGAEDWEQTLMVEAIEDKHHSPKGRIFFVHREPVLYDRQPQNLSASRTIPTLIGILSQYILES